MLNRLFLQLVETEKMKNILYLFVLILIVSCSSNKLHTDLLVKNATIYTVNENFEKAEAFVVKAGKIEEVGKLQDLVNKYDFADVYDAKNQTIIPGIIDAHAHLMYLGISLQQVDLTGTNSYEEVLKRVLDFQKINKTAYLIGRGWDQNDWINKTFPINLYFSLTQYAKGKEMLNHYNSEVLDFSFGAKVESVINEREIYVVVIGETARRKNFSLYGYNKKTNPFLEKQSNLICFKSLIFLRNH